MAIDGDNHALRRQAELAAHGVDDADIGLVRDQPVDVAAGEGVGGQRLVHAFREALHGVAEHFAPVHAQLGRQRLAGGIQRADGAVHEEDAAEAALGVQMGGEDAVLAISILGPEEDRPRPVAEQHASAAVGVVEDAGEKDSDPITSAPRDRPARMRLSASESA